MFDKSGIGENRFWQDDNNLHKLYQDSTFCGRTVRNFGKNILKFLYYPLPSFFSSPGNLRMISHTNLHKAYITLW